MPGLSVPLAVPFLSCALAVSWSRWCISSEMASIWSCFSSVGGKQVKLVYEIKGMQRPAPKKAQIIQ